MRKVFPTYSLVGLFNQMNYCMVKVIDQLDIICYDHIHVTWWKFLQYAGSNWPRRKIAVLLLLQLLLL